MNDLFQHNSVTSRLLIYMQLPGNDSVLNYAYGRPIYTKNNSINVGKAFEQNVSENENFSKKNLY